MRLTEKDYCGYDVATRKEQRDYTCEEIFDVLQKLGKLEDIEEELGIGLITLFKALIKDVYIKQGKKIVKAETPPILLNFDGEYYFEWHYEKLKNGFEQLPIKDYGKTWALTKEELL